MFLIRVNLKCEFLRSFVPVLFVCQVDVWSKISNIRQYSHYNIGLEMLQILNNISFSWHLWISFRIYIKFAKAWYTASLCFLTLNFTHKSSWKWQPFWFCPANNQNFNNKKWKKYFFREIYGKRSQTSW